MDLLVPPARIVLCPSSGGATISEVPKAVVQMTKRLALSTSLSDLAVRSEQPEYLIVPGALGLGQHLDSWAVVCPMIFGRMHRFDPVQALRSYILWCLDLTELQRFVFDSDAGGKIGDGPQQAQFASCQR